MARQVTGVEQHETLPDEIARRADQIELVDMTPEALRRRMVHGNVYPPNRVDAALTHYFRPGNLTALRELALLWLADRVEEGLQRYRAEHGIATPWETRERIVVAVAGEKDDEKVIRRAARIAARTPGSDLLAVHVVSDDGLAAGHDAALEAQRALVTSLGGSFRLLPGADVADALLSFARAENATQMVLGASRRSRLLTLIAGKSIPTRLARRAEHIDVHLVSRRGTADRGHCVRPGAHRVSLRKAQAERDSAEAAALTRLAGCVLRGHGDPPALLEEIRQMFGLDAVSLLEWRHERRRPGLLCRGQRRRTAARGARSRRGAAGQRHVHAGRPRRRAQPGGLAGALFLRGPGRGRPRLPTPGRAGQPRPPGTPQNCAPGRRCSPPPARAPVNSSPRPGSAGGAGGDVTPPRRAG